MEPVYMQRPFEDISFHTKLARVTGMTHEIETKVGSEGLPRSLGCAHEISSHRNFESADAPLRILWQMDMQVDALRGWSRWRC
jgi:hypothetical protein